MNKREHIYSFTPNEKLSDGATKIAGENMFIAPYETLQSINISINKNRRVIKCQRDM